MFSSHHIQGTFWTVRSKSLDLIYASPLAVNGLYQLVFLPWMKNAALILSVKQ